MTFARPQWTANQSFCGAPSRMHPEAVGAKLRHVHANISNYTVSEAFPGFIPRMEHTAPLDNRSKRVVYFLLSI